MQNVDNRDQKFCSGCGLCTRICPKLAIELQQREDGFYYPTIDPKLCINCGLCVRKCPFRDLPALKQWQSFKLCISKNPEILKNSASGGVFTHISDYVLQNGGVVYGAAYTSDFFIKHSRATNILNRNTFRDSKYVQSSIMECYENIADDLNSNRMVLFSGTPCQCKAIQEYLNYKKIDNQQLILLDIICHGVASPGVWEQYLKYVKHKLHLSTIDRVVTRNKTIGRGYNLTFYNGNTSFCLPGTQDPFINMFCKNLILRDSCYSCPLKSRERVGDISIGDFHNYRKFLSIEKGRKGVSLAIINSSKGREVFDKILSKIEVKDVSWDDSRQLNLTKPIMSMEKQKIFFSEFNQKGFNYVLYKYTEVGFFNHCIGVAKRAIKSIISII